jgi:dTDP-4-dehydrorhamnose reductase
LTDANATTWLFGATSLIGFALAEAAGPETRPFANPFNKTARRLGWPAVDVADPATIDQLLATQPPPDTVVYAHAVCTVSKCETHPQWTRSVNVGPVRQLVRHLPAATRFVYLSSDHVFGEDGCYDEASPPTPISVYGQTRVEAERAVLARPNALVIRPGLAVGPSLDGRTGHRDWLIRRSSKGLPISIVADEARSAMWSRDLADRLWALAQSSLEGICHLPAEQMVDRPTLAEGLMGYLGLAPRFRREARVDQGHPHLGRINLQTRLSHPLAEPLPSVMRTFEAVEATRARGSAAVASAAR